MGADRAAGRPALSVNWPGARRGTAQRASPAGPLALNRQSEDQRDRDARASQFGEALEPERMRKVLVREDERLWQRLMRSGVMAVTGGT